MRSWLLTTLPAAFAAVAIAAPLAACDEESRVPPPRTVAPSPTEGVDSAALAALLVEHWDLEVAVDPLLGTYLGDHRGDAELPPIRRDDVTALRARRRALLARVTGLDVNALSSVESSWAL